MKRISSNPKVKKARKNYNKTLNDKRTKQFKYATQHMELEEEQGEDDLPQGNTSRKRRATRGSSSSTRPGKAACTRVQGEPTPATSIGDTPAFYSPDSASMSQSRVQTPADPCDRPGSSFSPSLAPSAYPEGYNSQPQAHRDLEDMNEFLGDENLSTPSYYGHNTAPSVRYEQPMPPTFRAPFELVDQTEVSLSVF